jgi:hypothetical protein
MDRCVVGFGLRFYSAAEQQVFSGLHNESL